MKNWDEMTPQEQEDEMQLKVVFDTTKRDLSADMVVQQEVAMLLSAQPHLLGVYISLDVLYKQKLLDSFSQDEIAKMLNLSKSTYYQYRNDLIKLKLIRMETTPDNWRIKKIGFNFVSRIPAEEMKRRFRTHGKEHIIKWFLDMRKIITGVTPEEMTAIEKKEELELQQQQAELFKKEEIKEEAKKIVAKEKAKKKAEEQKFPKEDYKSIIDGYRKNKGVFIQVGSPDEMRIRKSAKQMFLSGHKVFDILECMRFFNKYCTREGYEWMGHWTIETVMKKMPEFKAGKLKLPELGDDLPVL